MNLRSRQAVTNSVKKDFFKLLNNVNFGCGSISNLDNCIFVPIYDEVIEISYIKNYNYKFISS